MVMTSDVPNPYEMLRKDKIAQNEMKLQELGIVNPRKSSTSLVKSSQNNKRKKNGNKRTNSSTARDVDSIPGNSDEEDILLSVEIPKKMRNTNIEMTTDNSRFRSRIYSDIEDTLKLIKDNTTAKLIGPLTKSMKLILQDMAKENKRDD